MGKYIVEGGHPLSGELQIQGAKNAALPILAAALLTGKSVIHNCPALSDIDAACNILNHLGCVCQREGSTITVDATVFRGSEIPDELMHEMRSSIVFLGAMIARGGEAKLSLPGGCELGPRPIDMHLEGLRRLGVEVQEDYGYLHCNAKKGLHGAVIALPFPSVGATENIMIAASVAQGDTELHNAAREPEIQDLADFLIAAGANIHIEHSGVIYIRGVKSLHACEHRVIPDRIVAATYLCAAAATHSHITLTGTDPSHLSGCLPLLEETGCQIHTHRDKIALIAPLRLHSIRMLRTMPYPGFPTDAQAPFMALCTLAEGTSVFVENIFENRYKHAGELMRMGANIKVEGRVAVVEGIHTLHAARLYCTDLRGGAALIIAALAAEGSSEILEIRHVQRGYEAIDVALAKLGGNVKRVENPSGI